MHKKYIVIFLIVINICLLTGCYNDIDQQVMVSGLAIDVGDEGKKYHVSAETIKPSEKEIETNVIETDGNTVFDALRSMISISSKKLYFGHCKSMFISEELAKEGIKELIDLLIRDHEARITMDIYITKECDAKDALMVEGVFDPIISYKANDLSNSPEKNIGDSPAVNAYKVFNGINAEGVSLALEAFKVTSVEDKKDIELCGTGVFNKDRLIGFLDKRETKNLSIMSNKFKNGLLTYKDKTKDLFISYEVLGNKGKTVIEFDGDKIKTVNVSTKTKVCIGEIGRKADFMNTDEVEQIKQILESEMKIDFYKLIEKAQSDLGCDIFGIGKQINMNYPELWEKYKKDWDKTFKTLDFNVDCKVEIIGSGISKSDS